MEKSPTLLRPMFFISGIIAALAPIASIGNQSLWFNSVMVSFLWFMTAFLMREVIELPVYED